MKREVIKVQNLSRSFYFGGNKQDVLKDVNFSIYEGDFTVIMGASGSGKSTLLYALSGMDKVSGGNVYYGDEDITKLTTDEAAIFRRKHIGFIFQQKCLLDTMTVLENVLISGLMTKCDKKDLVKRAKELLQEVEVEEHTWDKYPTQISGGKAQRVGIVRALINSPEVLFADEPTGSLNSKASEEVLDLFTKFNEKGQSIIMVTHDVKSALRANRVLYFKDGNIISECDLGKFEKGDEKRREKLLEFLGEMKW